MELTIKADKAEETETRLIRSKGETQELIGQLKGKLADTEDKLKTLRSMKDNLACNRQQTIEYEGRLDVRER